MNKYSVYNKSLQEYFIFWFGGICCIGTRLKKKSHKSAHPIRTFFFPTYLPHLCAISVAVSTEDGGIFFVLFVPHIFVHSFVLRWILLTTTHTFVLVSFLLPLSSMCLCILHYLSQFSFNKCLRHAATNMVSWFVSILVLRALSTMSSQCIQTDLFVLVHAADLNGSKVAGYSFHGIFFAKHTDRIFQHHKANVY